MATANHHALLASTKRSGVVAVASPSQVAARRRRRGVVVGAVIAIVLIALAVVLRSEGQDQQQPEEITLESPPVGTSESQPTPAPPPRGPPAAAPLAAVTAPEPPPGTAAGWFLPPRSAILRRSVRRRRRRSPDLRLSEGRGTHHLPVPSCAADAPATWSCVPDREQPAMAKCPASQPTAGARCAPAGLGCVYEAGLDGTGCTCQPGDPFATWVCVPRLSSSPNDRSSGFAQPRGSGQVPPRQLRRPRFGWATTPTAMRRRAHSLNTRSVLPQRLALRPANPPGRDRRRRRWAVV